MTRPPEVIAASGEAKAYWEAAMALANKAIYDTDGRGLTLAGRRHLTERVARAIYKAAPPTFAPKTALQHFADEVEASGEAEKHAVPHFAIPPSTDVATLQRELSIAYDQIVREREVVHELANALSPILDAYTRMLHFKAFTEEAIAVMPRVVDARAALAKVQS